MSKEQSLSSKLTYGVAYLFTGSTTALFINVFTLALIARKLGVENYGLYSTVIAFVGLFQFLTNLGVNRALLKEGSTNLEKAKTAFGNALFLKTLIMIPFLLLVCGFANLNGYSGEKLTILLIFTINAFLDSFGSVYVCLRRIFSNFGLISIARASRNILNFIFAYIAFQYEVSVMSLAFAMLTLSIISFLVTTINSVMLLKPNLNLKDIPELVKDSIIFSLNEFFTRLYSRVLIVILSLFAPLKVVGIFGIAIRFTRFATVLPRQVRGAALPTIYRILEDEQGNAEEILSNNEKSKKVFKVLLKYISIIAAAFIVVIYYFSGPIINLVVGSKYNLSIPLIQALSLFIFLRFVQAPFTLFLIALNKHKNLVMIQAVTSSILIGLCFIMVPEQMNYGACYALIISELILVLGVIAYGLQYSIWNLKDTFKLIVSPIIASGFACYGMLAMSNELNIFLKLSIFGLFYLILLTISKQLKPKDFELVKKVILRK